MQQLAMVDKSIKPEQSGCFDNYSEELMTYLTCRFDSEVLARRVCIEMSLRFVDSDILSLLGNPGAYLNSYGLKLGSHSY